ncbi:MAG: 30S ribosomal protein S8 [Nitrospira sp. WS238]|nr:30S ribosomal protein S8 [Nitrospira sp. WS238]
MITDPIADLLVRIGNAARRRQDVVKVPASKLKREILNILGKEGFIQGFGETQEEGHPFFTVQLRYIEQERPMITGMRRISKPGRRVYIGRDDVPKVRNGIGVAIISTSKGLMTDSESRRAGLGGEVLCSVW